MRERPILFSGAMVRAILDGRKTQTRRVIQSPARNMQRAGMKVIQQREPGDPWYRDHVWSMRGKSGVWGDYTHARFLELCPYGQVGDRLWVRETWAPLGDVLTEVMGRSRLYRADADLVKDDSGERTGWWCGDMFLEGAARPWRWRPSIHMPRWASRLSLVITDIRAERLQDISEEGAKAEGCEPDRGSIVDWGHGESMPVYRAGFARLWDGLNGSRPGCSWDANPWVWCVSFEREGGAP